MNKRLQEIEKRLSEIKIELEKEGADIDALEKETKDLISERKAILEKIEKRNKIINDITSGAGNPIPGLTPKPEENRTAEFTQESPEYRSAFLKHLRRLDLTEIEQRAFTTVAGSAGAVIPTQTQNRVIEIVKQYAPLLAEINLMQVPGGVRVPVEDVVSEATKHAENATITVSDDKLKYVDLFGYEITKLLQISKSVMQMSVDAFENWLTSNLGRSLAAKITSLIIGGSGDGEAKGINAITWNENNSITVGASASLTVNDVTALIGLLPGGYDANAKFLMSKKTLFTDFMPLKDSSKHDLVTREGNQYYIYGYPVMLDERIPLHEAILGDFRAGYYGNMPEEINVVNQFDIDTNSYKFLGTGMFDGKPALPDAFVKLRKAAS
mgnify:CR=1 FL=1